MSPVAISLIPACCEAALLVALHERDPLLARGQEQEYRFRLGVFHTLDERPEIRILQRRVDAADHLAAGRLERFAERLLGIEARTVVGHHAYRLS